MNRTASLTRTTKETTVAVTLDLDGGGTPCIDTGIGFFDHMLTALSLHSGVDMNIHVKGDLEVDCHHTIEDTGIVLGQALSQALAQKGGITRYGSCTIPMDEALAFVSLDISGRPFLVFSAAFSADRIGEMDTQMVEEFFRAFAYHAGMTLHAKVLYGANDHHKTEALFKALAHALQSAVQPLGNAAPLSTKGVL